MRVDALKANLNNLEDEIAQTEKIGLGDFFIAGALALVVGVLSCVWGLPYLHPSVWGDCTIAAGVRPTGQVMPGYFMLVGDIVYRLFGLSHGTFVLKSLGRISLALMAVFMYVSLREMLVFIMRARPQYSRRRKLVMQAAGIVGAFAFVMSDPIWSLGQFLSESVILLILSLLTIECFFLFLRKGRLRWSYLCAIFLGLLCAESPFGLFLLLIFLTLNHIVLKVLPVLESPFYRPELIAVGKWHMTFLFMASLIIGIALNSFTYIAHGGFGANGTTLGSIPLDYLLCYWGRINSAASVAGWVMLLGVCLTPFIVTIVRFPVAADEESFLSYPTGIVFLVCGVTAFSQSASLPALWFWTQCPVASSYLLAMGLLLTAATLAISVTVLGVDFLCRDHRRLALQLYGRDEEIEAARRLSERQGGVLVFLRRVGFVTLPFVLILLMVPARLQSITQKMLILVRDVIHETIREAGDVDYLFTGGHLDDILEFESVGWGHHLKCLPLVGGQSLRDKYLRTRGMSDDAESSFSFNYDVGMGLRTWIRDKPARLKDCAVQMGFDLWKRDGKPLPPMGGLLSRPTGWPDEAERLAGIERAHILCNRALDLAHENNRRKCPDAKVREAFNTVQWRLARMCLVRAEANDLKGDAPHAIAENDLGNSLNGENEIYKEIMDSLARVNEKMMQRLTPREGLQLALVRAHFNMGKYYAKMVLATDPENGDANFAMGMYFSREKQWFRAEEYLTRCLLSMPNQPAVYNNLAMVQIELGKLDAAEINAKKALEIVPEAAAVMETRNRIKKAREALEEKAQEKQ